MIKQCKRCPRRGDYYSCIKTDCLFLEKMLIEKIKQLESIIEKTISCPECGEPDPVMHCESCGHNFNQED